jgi:hypothetical protein
MFIDRIASWPNRQATPPLLTDTTELRAAKTPPAPTNGGVDTGPVRTQGHRPWCRRAKDRLVVALVEMPESIRRPPWHQSAPAAFEMVVLLRDGGLAHYWRNNDDPACSGTGHIRSDGIELQPGHPEAEQFRRPQQPGGRRRVRRHPEVLLA